MANSGGAGAKFVSANLNNSYGSVANHHQPYGSNSYGQSGPTRIRPSSYGIGGGGGMVVLSRPRSSQKAGVKLSVPPPLNLPSLRKEHERYELSGPSGGLGGGLPTSGGGSKPTVSGPGWMKPATLALQEQDRNVAVVDSMDKRVHSVDTPTGGSAGYIQPSARTGRVGFPGSVSAPSAEKTAVLRGEDFPSLRAALPSSVAVPVQKQKDSAHQKYKQVLNEQTEIESAPLSSLVDKFSHEKSLGRTFGNESNENAAKSHGLCSSQMVERDQKQDYFPSPLPLVRLNPRFDWADDERDTGQKFADRGRVYGYSESELSNKYRGDVLQNSSVSMSSFSSGGKGLPVNDPILIAGRDKRAFLKSERPYLDNPFLNDVATASFDEGDPFSSGLVGVIKRKKDAVKQADVYDPVRESFEAELERVQKMQEQERRQIVEEQERALEQARREEEERWRLIREEEEQRRRLEEEAREAAWKAEQERLEAVRRAEEQKMAKEEERHQILAEEERRKHAAKQKLLELEARIAKRQAEAENGNSCAATADEKVAAIVIEKDVSRVVEADNWEDSEGMLARITTSGSSDSSGLNRSFELGPRPQSSEEGFSGFLDRQKSASSWRRDAYEDGNNSPIRVHNQDNGQRSVMRDAIVGGRAFSRKELYGGAGHMLSRTYYKGPVQQPHMEDFTHLKEHKWNATRDGDPYNRNTGIDPEFHETSVEKYGDVGWGHSHSRANPRSRYPELQHSEEDERYSYGRSRYSLRQPRVLPPPPSLVSMPKTSCRGENGHPVPSTSVDNNMHYDRALRSESSTEMGYYDGQLQNFEVSEKVDVQPRQTMTQEQNLDGDTTSRCDSQSSLSVSSPPHSPTYLSHDDLDESGNSPVVSTAKENEIHLSGNESVLLNANSGRDTVMAASSLISAVDDDDWTLEDNEELQEQEEYDEDEDGYHEEDEVHEGDDENIDLSKEFEDLHLQEKNSSPMMDNLVLGFNEGVEVGIPSDEVESGSRNEEGTFGFSEVSVVGLIEDQEPVNGTQSDAKCLQTKDNFLQKCSDSSSLRIQEAENRIPCSITEPTNAASEKFPVSGTSICMDGSSNSGECAQHTVPSLVNTVLHSSSAHAIMSTLPVGSSQSDLPVKLQFGLFSGPSLIPSPPVPSIQFGSIQMPLPLHPPLGPSLTQIHPSQPPLFQFGQLRYTSAISQGISPMASQSVSFVQPNVQAHYNLNQSSGVPLPMQPSHVSSSHNLIHDDIPYASAGREITESNVVIQKCQDEISHAGETKNMSAQGSEAGDNHDAVVKNNRPSSNGTVSGQLHNGPRSFKLVASDKDSKGSKEQGAGLGTKERKYAYSSGNSRLRSSISFSKASHSDSSRVQRRPQRAVRRFEFRVRENVDRRQSSGLASSNYLTQDDKPNFTWCDVGTSVRNRPKKRVVPDKTLKQIVEPETSSAGPFSSQGTDSGTRVDKKIEKEAAIKTQNISKSVEGNLKRTLCTEEDVEAPLQSGIVRVFTQPGIEASSDEDDFIEVRSKRQMLNHRREQREKEIKAKSRVTKASWKSGFTGKNAVVSTSSNKISAPLGGEAQNSVLSDVAVAGEQVNMQVSAGFVAMVSQPLAPSGTLPVTSDAQPDKNSHNIKSLQKGGKDFGPGLLLETKNNILDNVQKSLGSWGNEQISQQVMALTQTQLDEAMKPGRFDTHVASIGDHSSSFTESSSKDKLVSSAASPINSLLAGEKIQFGAVTSPTLLPPKSRAISNGIGAPGSCRPDFKISPNLPVAEKDLTLFYEKGKHQNECSVQLEDSEAEAEAAASAVAVAAISSDEIAGNSLGTCSVCVSVSDTKSFGVADIHGFTRGVAADQQLASQSRAEESLSVSLPADLSLETPPISFWQPLPSPQNSSSQMLSHFPIAPSSRFPFYKMNPMLGGPIFTFGPQDDSAKTKSQPQKRTASGSGPLGTWQHCHSGMDSFFGPPTGFTGPYISSSGGIPALQGPPHMVVYNHFPVGQFGQVGLSFMGTTYIPSGKQPDWKHNPTSSAVGIGEVDLNNINLVSAQRNPANMAAPVQHLAPGSQLLPMASPFATFDMSPFQSADMSVQGRWTHVPAMPLHSVPPPMPLQQQDAGKPPSKFSHGQPVGQSLTANRCSESRSSSPPDSSQSFPVTVDVGPPHLSEALGLVDSSSLASSVKSSSGDAIAAVDKSDGAQNGLSTDTLKSRSSQQRSSSAPKYSRSTGYNYQRGGASQKNSSGSDWSQHHRRMGYHGRSQFVGTEKGHPSSKLKQIYVAKQNKAGTSTVS